MEFSISSPAAAGVSSAQACVDPDRMIVKQFESGQFGDQPITVVTSDPLGRCVTFALHHQDHTLGNALRWQISTYPEQEIAFVGYTVPHPSEAKIHLRIQVSDDAPADLTAVTVLRRALVELKGLYGVIRERFGAECARIEK